MFSLVYVLLKRALMVLSLKGLPKMAQVAAPPNFELALVMGNERGRGVLWWAGRALVGGGGGAFGHTVEREAKVEEEAEDSEPGFALGGRRPPSQPSPATQFVPCSRASQFPFLKFLKSCAPCRVTSDTL